MLSSLSLLCVGGLSASRFSFANIGYEISFDCFALCFKLSNDKFLKKFAIARIIPPINIKKS